MHFHRYGWREGRQPNPYFDPGWYLRQNEDVRLSGQNPLLHYIEHGEGQGRAPIPWFDPLWYRARYRVPATQLALAHFLAHRHGGQVSPIPEFDAVFYLQRAPDVAACRMDPFEHYLVRGAAENRLPSAEFDPVFYRGRYLRGQSDTNPLLHYRLHRGQPGIWPKPPPRQASIPEQVRQNTQPGPMFEKVHKRDAAQARRAMLLAFYLPQFHPVPDNDAWWGDGFTEWTNVARGLPRFVGHYQPRIPRDLGHYRLDGPETLRRQAAMARDAGLHGFIFYFYWFNRRRLLDGPLEALLADRSIDLPFALMWANENWTRRWDGSEDEVLISQDYRQEDEAALAAAFCRHFADPRYIRFQGRPVLFIYRASLIVDAGKAIARLRRLFLARGHQPLLVMAQSFTDRDPRDYDLDAALEFPPHKLTDALVPLNPALDMLDDGATARVYAYDDLAASTDLSPHEYPLIRTALPGWDNDARRQGAGMVLHGSTPAAYQAWLERLIDAAVDQPVFGQPVVCINAWNEWAEGAYLEPDVHFGGAYLNATARAVAVGTAGKTLPRVLLVGHDAFSAGSQLLLLNLGRQLRRTGRVEVEFLLLDGGALAAQYQEVAPTTILGEKDGLEQHAAIAAARGFRAALVNSAASGFACRALTQAGVACTMLVHELPRLLRDRNLVEAARAGADAARRLVFAAPYVRDRFAELVPVPMGRDVVLPQGLYSPVEPGPNQRLRARLRLPAGALLAVGIGYGDLRKGFDLFLQCWRVAQNAGDPMHLAWVGNLDPAVQSYLGAEMAAAKATGTFYHIPFCKNGADWLAAADVHLLTSREDPFPSVVLEAMSAGIPTVAFEEGGGAPDVLRDHRAGMAVPLGDVTAMVQAARTVHRFADVRARLSAAVRAQFDFADYAGRLLALALPVPISVVIPNYNYARFLPARLQSIFAQTYPVQDVTVLDDASDDGSAAVVTDAVAAGHTVRWVGSRTRSGSVFRQWRRAASLASGEFLWLAEADDMAEPGLLAVLAYALQRTPDAPFAFCDSRAVDAQGRTLWPDHQAYYAASGAPALAQDGVFAAQDFLRFALGARNLMLNASAVLWRRQALLAAFDRCGPALDGLVMAGDWRLYAEAASGGGSIAYVAQPLNLHRRHEASVTALRPAAKHLDEIRRMHRHLRTVLGRDPDLVRAQRAALAAAKAALQPAGKPTLALIKPSICAAPVAPSPVPGGG